MKRGKGGRDTLQGNTFWQKRGEKGNFVALFV
jgi:hypothetical protein